MTQSQCWGTRGVGTVQKLSHLHVTAFFQRCMQAYELLQGPLVRWSKPGADVSPPTAVLVHGILGSRRNMQSFARMLLEVRVSNARAQAFYQAQGWRQCGLRKRYYADPEEDALLLERKLG